MSPREFRYRWAMDGYYYRVKNRHSAIRLWDQVLTSTEREKLGGDCEAAYRVRLGAIGMWTRLRGCTEVRAIIELAKILGFCDDSTRTWLLRESDELSSNPEEALQMAIANADLVLTEAPRSAYWKGGKIDIDWDRNSALWDYFVTLCTAAKSGRYVDASDFGEHRASDYHIKMKSRLTTLSEFPAGLEERLTAQRGGRQKLTVPPDRIRILQLESREVVSELQGA